MRAVYITDIHAHNYKQFDTEGSRLTVCMKVIDDVYKFCDKNDIHYIFFGGDLYDKQGAIPTVVINAMIAKFREKTEQYPSIIWIAISGNHDQASKNLIDQPAVTALEHLAVAFPIHFKLIDNAMSGNNDYEEYRDFRVCGIPYYEFPEHYNMALDNMVKANDELGYDKPVILLIHQTPKGANPMIPWDTDPVDLRYDKFDLVLCGHIHQRQEFTERFLLGGSPLHRDLGDEGNEKGWHVMDTDDPAGTLTFFSTKGRYPEYFKVKGEVPEGMEGQYVIVEPNIFDELSEQEEIEIEKFNAGLKPEELIKNFWETVDGKDELLLEQGLEFLK